MHPDISKKEIEKAFQVDYKGSVIDTFHERLRKFHAEWKNEGKPYAPYIAIIQSSGSGKTRLVGELKTKRIYVLYIYKRADDSNGYPATTLLIEKIFDKIRDDKFHLLLYTAIKQISDNHWSEQEFWDLQTRGENSIKLKEFWENIIDSAELSAQNDHD